MNFVADEDLGGGNSGTRRKSSPLLKSTLFDAKPSLLLHVQTTSVFPPSSSSPSSSSAGLGRSSSFKIHRSSSPDHLSPDDVKSSTGVSGSKSLPTTPVERVTSTDDREVFTQLTMVCPPAASLQRNDVTLDRVVNLPSEIGQSPTRKASLQINATNDSGSTASRHQQYQPVQLKHNRRRKSTGSEEDVANRDGNGNTLAVTGDTGVAGTSSTEDPWIENRPQQQRKSSSSSWRRLTTTDHVAALAAVIGYGIDRSPVSPPPLVNAMQTTGSSSLSPNFDGRFSLSGYRSAGGELGEAAVSAFKQRKRFSVSHHHRHSTTVSGSTAAAAAALSNSPLDLAGVLGKYDAFL